MNFYFPRLFLFQKQSSPGAPSLKDFSCRKSFADNAFVRYITILHVIMNKRTVKNIYAPFNEIHKSSTGVPVSIYLNTLTASWCPSVNFFT